MTNLHNDLPTSKKDANKVEDRYWNSSNQNGFCGEGLCPYSLSLS